MRTRWTPVAKQLAITGAYFERRQGTRLQAAAYCKKTGTRYYFKDETNILKHNKFEYRELESAEKNAVAGKLKPLNAWLEQAKDNINTTGKMPKLVNVPVKILFSNTFDHIANYVGNNISYTELKDRCHTALMLHRKSGIRKSYTTCKIAEEIFGVDSVLKITVTDHARLWFPPATIKPEA